MPKNPIYKIEARARQLHQFLTVAAICRLNDDGRKHECMRLPSPIFEELCVKILDRKLDRESAFEWLKTATQNSPKRSSVFRFAILLSERYQASLRDYLSRGA